MRTEIKRVATLTLTCVLLFLLTSCGKDFEMLPDTWELEAVALVRTMGLDVAEKSDVSVVVSTGDQSQGGKHGQEGPIVLQEQSGTIGGACLAMQGKGAAYVFYGHVGQLLLGEEMARRGIEEALDYTIRDVEMRLETNLYLIKENTAEQAIRSAAKKGSATERLEAMELDKHLVSNFMVRTVEDVVGDVGENGCSFLPALELSGKDEEMTAVGFGLIKESRLIGWAEGEAGQGVKLLKGNVGADMLEIDVPEKGRAALRMVDSGSRIKPVFNGDQFTGLKILCQVDANLAQGCENINLSDRATYEYLEGELIAQTENRLRAAVALSQNLNGDFFHMKTQAGLAAPWRWSAIQAQWSLPDLEVEIEVKGRISRGYDIRD